MKKKLINVSIETLMSFFAIRVTVPSPLQFQVSLSCGYDVSRSHTDTLSSLLPHSLVHSRSCWFVVGHRFDLWHRTHTRYPKFYGGPKDMKIGDEIRSRIDESIRMYDKLLLVLSEHSVGSAWVKKEVETAFEKESQQNRHVLFPARLDDAVMQTSQAWAADIRRMRHIGDFRE